MVLVAWQDVIIPILIVVVVMEWEGAVIERPVVVIELIIGKETLLLITLRKYQLILVVVVLQILSLILQIRRT